MDVCTVHHHGSKFSSNDNWRSDITAGGRVLSVGSNSYGHPTAEALARLHAHWSGGYWTERASNVAPLLLYLAMILLDAATIIVVSQSF